MTPPIKTRCAAAALFPYRARPVLTYPPRSLLAFPERSGDWPAEYPAVIHPWIGGLRAYWVHELQAFQLESGRVVRVDGIEPYVPDNVLGHGPTNLLGEFWEKGATYEETLANVLQNEPPDGLDFYIFDAEMPHPAVDRALYCLNLPRQYERHTRIAEVCQVNTPGGFRDYLERWRKSFNGGLAVGYQDPWLATEYEVKTLL